MIRSALAASFMLVACSQLGMAGVINVEATRTTTETVFFPPRPTAAAVEHVYASVITSSPDLTEYLLACEPVFTSPYPESCHDFAGVTLTHGASTMRVEIGPDPDIFDCVHGGEDAVCAINAGPTQHPSVTIPSAESATWFTAISVVPQPVNLELRRRGV